MFNHFLCWNPSIFLEGTLVKKEFTVQLQTFTTSEYLLKNNALIIISCKIERKFWKNYVILLK